MKTIFKRAATLVIAAAIAAGFFAVPVTVFAQDPDMLEIRTYSTSSQLTASSFNTLTIPIRNKSATDALDVTVTVSFGENQVYALDEICHIGTIPAGETKYATYSLSILGSPSTYVSLDITAEYNYNDGTVKNGIAEKQYSLYFPSGQQDEPDTKKPELILAAFSFSKSELTAGDTFAFTYDMKLASWEKNIKNLRTTVSCDGVIIPEGVTNTVITSSVMLYETVRHSQNFVILPSVGTGMYAIRISAEYQDLDGNIYNTDFTVNVKILSAKEPVTGPPELSIVNCTVTPESAVAGNEVTIRFGVRNTGKTDAEGVTVAPEGLSVDTFSPVKSGGLINVGLVRAGETVTAELRLKSNVRMSGGIYPIRLATSYDGAEDYKTGATVYIPVSAAEINEATLALHDVSVTGGAAKPGSETSLTLTLANLSDFSASGVSVKLKGFAPGTATLKGFNDTVVIGDIAKNSSAKANFTLNIASGASASIQLGITVTYKNSIGETVTEDFDFFVPVEKKPDGTSPQRPRLFLDSFSVSSGVINPGDTFKFSYTIRNLSASSGARNLEISVSSASFMPADGLAVIFADNIAADGVRSGSINLAAGAGLESGMYPVTLNITYEDETGAEFSEALTAYIQVTGENEGTAGGTPRVILDSYSLDTDSVTAGKPFTFTFYLKNTSTSFDIGNMKVSLYSTDGIFSPVTGSNTFFVERLNRGETVEISLELTTSQSTETKSYPLTLNLEYETDAGRSYTASENISFAVSQPVRFDISNFYCPSSIPMGNSVYISFQYYNKSKSAFSNLEISIEGEGFELPEPVYVGNIPASTYSNFDANIFPYQIGTVSGNFVFSFEDSSGKLHQIKHPFSMEVFEADFPVGPVDPEFPPISPDDGGDEKKNGLNPWILWGSIGGGAAVLLTVAAVIIVRVRKKKIELAEDEEY